MKFNNFIKVLIFLFFIKNLSGQEILKENLTKKTIYYHDFLKTKPQSMGSFYKDVLGETNLKHGKWEYFDENEKKIEIRNYYKDKLNGKIALYYPNGFQRQEGYFIFDVQDSIYREWNENGKLTLELFYNDGRQEINEEYIDSIKYVWNFWLPDSLHTQTITKGEGEMTTYFNTGTVKEWYNYKNGLPDGEFIERSIYGYDLLTGTYKDGLKIGTWKTYYYTGKIEKIANYSNGKLDGKYEYFYDNNQLNVEGFYREGLKIGEWTWFTKQGNRDMQGSFLDGKWNYWHPTSELSYIANYKEDLKEGTWTYFYKNGTKFKVGNFSKDEKNGKWETFYEDGTLLLTGSYINGKEEGDWFNFWENGKIKNKSSFKKGVLNGEWYSYYPKGDLKLKGYYKKGFKSGTWIDFFEDNKPKDVITYKVIKVKSKIKYGPMKGHYNYESVKNGKSVSFSAKDFKMTEEGTYKNGEKDGEWIAYYPGGKMPANSTSYKKGLLDGKMKEYDRKGQIISEIDYKDGLKHGKMKIYDKKGKVVVEKKFEFGLESVKGSGSFTPGK